MVIGIIILVLVIVILPGIFLFIKQLPVIYEIKELLDEPFVCPNCGHRFYLKMHQVWYKIPSFYIANGLKAKCPCCKQIDVCSRSKR